MIPLGPLPRRARLKGAHPTQHKGMGGTIHVLAQVEVSTGELSGGGSQKVCTSTLQHTAKTAESSALQLLVG